MFRIWSWHELLVRHAWPKFWKKLYNPAPAPRRDQHITQKGGAEKGDAPKTRMFFEFWTTSAHADGWFARFGSPSAVLTENGVGCAGEGW